MPTSVSRFRELSEILNLNLRDNLFARWYPLVLDKKYGGYFTNLSHQWRIGTEQEKMIVSQSRHVWVLSKAAMVESETQNYEGYARHGFHFLHQSLWDSRYGGFYQIRNREGGYSDCRGWGEEKRTHGNSCAIFALAALYNLTHDPEVLALAKDAFEWLETHAHDDESGGYFQFLTRQGEPFDETSQYRSVASDIRKVGLKDYNSSVHLLEAYTELLRVWNTDVLHSRLTMLLELIRDTMVVGEGYLQLYFTRDWIPVTFRAASEATRSLNYGLDRVSFGDDLKTAFLLLDAAHVLKTRNDERTLAVAKHMVDHAISTGWDGDAGGFFDSGYYPNGSDQCSIIRFAKPWWTQAEALNTLLIFSCIFPGNAIYRERFEQQWSYIDKHLLDHSNGDWFERGTDKDPQARAWPKGHMWKCTYHTGRALMNCIALTSDKTRSSPGILARRRELDAMIDYWKMITFSGEQESIVTTHSTS